MFIRKYQFNIHQCAILPNELVNFLNFKGAALRVFVNVEIQLRVCFSF